MFNGYLLPKEVNTRYKFKQSGAFNTIQKLSPRNNLLLESRVYSDNESFKDESGLMIKRIQSAQKNINFYTLDNDIP